MLPRLALALLLTLGLCGCTLLAPRDPLQIDLAYGLKVEKLRLHLTVGWVF